MGHQCGTAGQPTDDYDGVPPDKRESVDTKIGSAALIGFVEGYAQDLALSLVKGDSLLMNP